MGERNAVWLSRQLGTNEIVLRGETNVSNDEPISVTVNDPSMFAATVLSETLAANGVRVTGQVIRDRTIRATLSSTNISAAPATKPSAAHWSTVAVHTTPLGAVLARANKDSMNLYAEALCKRIGAAVTNKPGSWESGTAAVSAYLQSLGVSRDEFNLVDGCGLSRKDNISPHAMVAILARNFHEGDHATFLNSLAVSGIDGTLDNRFREAGVRDLKGRVFGKSGYISAVRSLSGYLKARDGRWYAFSILMNNLVEGDYVAKQVQERIVKAIDVASNGGVARG
jgi:D-alanyl-D-alanine carboxypeptidase/D-alanyl-D-alanine-endopeptidase (penicillin-binding protein 4)